MVAKVFKIVVLSALVLLLGACSSKREQVIDTTEVGRSADSIEQPMIYDDEISTRQLEQVQRVKTQQRQEIPDNDDFIARCPQAQLPLFPDQGPYETKALFVQVPATIGRYIFGTIGYAVGIPLGLTGYPINRDYNYCTAPSLNNDIGLAGSALVGFPFWVVKGIVWDFPGYLLNGPS